MGAALVLHDVGLVYSPRRQQHRYKNTIYRARNREQQIKIPTRTHTHTHTHARARARLCPLSGTTRVSRYQKGETNLDFTEARDSERQWHQLVHMQVCTSLQTDNHASTPPLSFLWVGRPSCRPTKNTRNEIKI